MDDVNLFKNITVLSLEQATVLPYLTFRLVEDGVNVIISSLSMQGKGL